MVMNVMLAACLEYAGRRLTVQNVAARARCNALGLDSAFSSRRLAHGFLVLLLLSGKVAADPATQDAAVSHPAKSDEAIVASAKHDAKFEKLGISSNIRAASGLLGWGQLGRALGLSEESGISIGGILHLDSNWLVSGGVRPNSALSNVALALNASLDSEKVFGIPGGKFGVEFAEISAGAVNDAAGSVQLYNSFPDAVPRSRQEMTQLWWQQRLFNDKLIFNIGKMNGAGLFGVVLNPVNITEPQLQDYVISNLILTPIGINPTLLGRLPTFADTAYGVTVHFAPTKNMYAAYGLFDGNVASGIKTGLEWGPDINSYKFHIGELGYAWRLGEEGKPGRFGVGAWGQTGKLFTPSLTAENGATGFYLFSNQRLWYQHSNLDNSGVIGYLQFAYNGSDAGAVKNYVGAGLTGIGLVPKRPTDTISFGMARSELNDTPGAGEYFYPGVASNSKDLSASELMFQAAYQANFFIGKFGNPNGFSTFHILAAYTYIPTPGQRPDLHAAHALTAQFNLLF